MQQHNKQILKKSSAIPEFNANDIHNKSQKQKKHMKQKSHTNKSSQEHYGKV